MSRLLLINPRSGDAQPGVEEVAAAARRLDVRPHVLRDGEDPRRVALASGADVVGAAGGDGSLAPVAAAALETGAAFVCIPFGTRNHFGRDLGLDRSDPVGALAAFADGVELRVDVGRVGDRIFLNNVSLGAYAGLVHRRERRRRRGEALASVRALGRVARSRHRLHAAVDGERVTAQVLLVGNNRYELSLFTLGARERLDRGELQLWVAEGWLPVRWRERRAAGFRIELERGRVRAAADGEPVLLETPLELASLPGALRVLVPRARTEHERTVRIGGPMHDNPSATEHEQEIAHEEGRQQDEEGMRYPEHHDPEEQRRRARAEPDEGEQE